MASQLLSHVPDYQQPWVSTPSIVERNLCTPTAFASQLGALVADGRLAEVPIGTPYAPVTAYDSGYGWMHFAYDGPTVSSSTPPTWGAVSGPNQPAFDWWFNTNGNGASNAPTKGQGTVLLSAILGAEQFYQRTQLATAWWAAVHASSTIFGPAAPAGFSPQDPGSTLQTLQASIAQNTPVVLFLDSYDVTDTGTTVSVGDTASVHLFYIKARTQQTAHLEQQYTPDDTIPEEAVGHTVVMVGHLLHGGCDWIVVQDNDHTTPRYVALPFSHACGGTRSAYGALLASFAMDAPSPPPASASSAPPAPSQPPPTTCVNTCDFALDNVCDDGGPGSEFAFCGIDTDCTDCGSRAPPPPKTPPPPLPVAPPPSSPPLPVAPPPSSQPLPVAPPPSSPPLHPGGRLQCQDVRTLYSASQCCEDPSATTCMQTIPSCAISEAGSVCTDGDGRVVVKGLREAFDLSNAAHVGLRKHLIPEQNAAVDLGNAERKVRHLFLSDNR